MKNPSNSQPEQLITDLTAARARLGNRLKLDQAQSSGATQGSTDPLPVALAMLGRSAVSYVRAQVSPVVIVHFAKRHPVLIGVGLALALLAGPARILTTLKKAVTVFSASGTAR